ncbi:MAG: DUF1499 domain-containing protein [Rhodospirillaceae bacterium]|jgi:uncharacterized protein (DUF1499 family)|nr:DUF1499 domain-containing protein [Rhodospirillaceae bacterium]MBT5082885.1 DUF1499 domain-containing protein [Rhodospirillaceae bacterium]MBT5524329.1 DUF1499 domain-containing protein [Rhodospirillaceae bacterium]MBT5878875.1 DUF1499 domain-containing protein [Rhodospirillaceae bacterium]MBT6590695.1 DUF1499 domain-containing protein [Rhodospirillaceae bacterium]
MGKQLKNSIKAVVALAALLVVVFVVLGAEKSLTVVFGPMEALVVDFKTLQLTPKPNQFLVCPEGHCQAKPHMISPVFAISAIALKDRWMTMLADQPRITAGAKDGPGLQYDFVQRSKLMRFPDSITVRFIPLDESRSTLAIYSRSHYGRSDFGVNEARIQVWLAALE